MPHDRRPPPATLTNDELKSLAETARIAAEWGRHAHPLVVADLAEELSAARAALEEARGALAALKSEATRLIPMANAISFLPDGGVRWADRVRECADNIRRGVDTALAAESKETDDGR